MENKWKVKYFKVVIHILKELKRDNVAVPGGSELSDNKGI